MVATPALFVLFGVFLDGRLGTGPVLAVAFGLFGVVGVFVSSWYEYKAKMDRAEAGKPWAKQ